MFLLPQCPPNVMVTKVSGEENWTARFELLRVRWLDGPHSGNIVFDRVRQCEVLFRSPYRRPLEYSSLCRECEGQEFEELLAYRRSIVAREPTAIDEDGSCSDGRLFFTEPEDSGRSCHLMPGRQFSPLRKVRMNAASKQSRQCVRRTASVAYRAHFW
jgi:hypothetical protein